jgi:hypothetical protein
MSTFYTLSPDQEALAVRLIAHDKEAWKDLLFNVSPTFGDPVADKVGKIMKNRLEKNVPYSEMGDMIREMLYVKGQQETNRRRTLECDMCEGYGTPGRMYVCDDTSIPCPGCTEGYDEEDGYEMAKKTFLKELSKERLIELVLMDEEERSHVLHEGALATPIEVE